MTRSQHSDDQRNLSFILAIGVLLAQPTRVFDTVSDQALSTDIRPSGLTITVPEFNHLAVVVIEY
jgi:hypothetical protein